MRRPGQFLAYVAVLAVLAGVAWQFRTVPVPPSAEDAAFPSDVLRRMAEAGIDTPDHLYPEDAYVDGLTPRGRQISPPDFSIFKAILNDGTVRIYQIVDPSFFAPSIVGLKNVDGNYKIFAAEGAASADARMKCERPFSKALGDRVVAAWEKVLLETRPTTKVPYGGSDGAFLHFGAVTRSGLISGKIWTPPKPYKPGWLWQLGTGLATMCEQVEGAKVPAELEAALRAIEAAK